jgi:hypothetical protein
MSEPMAQTYANHRRFDPWYHVVILGLLGAAFIAACVRTVRHPATGIWDLILAIGVLLLCFRVRIYALKVQDRLIRLEETLRMKAILPEAWHVRIRELTPGQFVGLRFASDEELPALLQAALEEKLDGEAIKKRIRIWRPDTFRI